MLAYDLMTEVAIFMEIDEIKSCLLKELANLSIYNIKRVGIFGSYVRNEQKKNSDIDILIEFENDDDIDLLMFIYLKNYLSDCLGKKVDLVMQDTLKPNIGKRIMREVIYI